MGYHHQEETSDQPEGLPALLAVFDPFDHRDIQGIVEDLDCLFEPDAVLTLVGKVLCFVPFEAEVDRDSIVITSVIMRSSLS
jgi:hypothetical protein